MSTSDDLKKKAIDWVEEKKEVIVRMDKTERVVLWMMAVAFAGVGFLAGKFF